MSLKFFKVMPIVFLLLVFLLPQYAFAQSNVELIKSYERGELKNPTLVEKQIVLEYLESIKLQGPYWQKKVLSPDEIIYIDEDFSTATGTTPPTGWTQNTIAAILLLISGTLIILVQELSVHRLQLLLRYLTAIITQTMI
jgi:hypothetical protein